jgi:PKD domain
MFPGEGGRPDPDTAEPFMTEAVPYAGVDLEVGPEGDLYYASLGEGQIHRIAYFSGNQPPVARLKVDHPWSTGDLEAEFDASESSDAESEPLEYEWDTNEDGEYSPPSTNPTVNREWTEAGNHVVAVRVVDGQGLRSVAKLTVYPHDTPPDPQIVFPAESLSNPGKAELKWHVGQQIHFEGLATDAQDGELEHTNLDWNTRVLHCPFGPEACHFHPLRAFPGETQGTLTAPDHDYPSRIVLSLRATDSRGLAMTRTLELEAQPVQLEVESQPAGIPVTASLLTEATPFALTVIEDSHVTLVAPATATVGGAEYEWTGWSDGGGRAHTIEAHPAGAYKAIYAPVSQPPKEEAGGGEKPSGGGSAAPGSGPGSGGAVRLSKAAIGGHPAKRSHSSSARFTFSVAAPGTVFECKLDGGRYRPCTSPRTYRKLRPGKHVFGVIAVKPDGQAKSAPAVFHWKVLA